MDTFIAMDTNNDNKIDIDEAQEWYGFEDDDEWAHDMFYYADWNSDGLIDEAEHAAVWQANEYEYYEEYGY